MRDRTRPPAAAPPSPGTASKAASSAAPPAASLDRPAARRDAGVDAGRMSAERYVAAHELRPVDLGLGIEHFLFNWDEAETKPYPMARWVNGDGEEAWLSTRALQCLALALSVGADEGAYRLGISTSTFKKHLTKTFQKLGVTTKWEAASELGWIRLPPSLQASLED
jgi:DNA-binding CsgD family transcriptional regulator